MSRRWETLKKTKREEGYFGLTKFLASRALRFVRTGALQPPNTIEANLELWSRYDWSLQGQEWSANTEWHGSLLTHVLEPNIPVGSRVLEIGCGAGRWTDYLVRRAKHVIAVDLTAECIRICKERFSNCDNISYLVNDGQDLSFIPHGSIDRIWSFDVFVHIQSTDVEKYVRQFADILTDGGRGIVHHSATGVKKNGWRSDMTAERMIEMSDRHGLAIVKQFDSWDNERFGVSGQCPDRTSDVVTVFEKRGTGSEKS
jgi:SAM-dependent methyltransferase